MTLKQKIKTYSFWISLVSAILIIIRVVCEQLNLIINESVIMDVVTGICGVLVLLGILSSPTQRKEDMQDDKIIEQVKDLNNTIKEDISNTQMSIQEQIEFLQKKSNIKQNEVLVQDSEAIVAQEDSKLNDNLQSEQDCTNMQNTYAFAADNCLVVDNPETGLSQQNLQNLQENIEILAKNCSFAEDFVSTESLVNPQESLDLVEESQNLSQTILPSAINDEQKDEENILEQSVQNNNNILLDIKNLLLELIKKLD